MNDLKSPVASGSGAVKADRKVELRRRGHAPRLPNGWSPLLCDWRLRRLTYSQIDRAPKLGHIA